MHRCAQTQVHAARFKPTQEARSVAQCMRYTRTCVKRLSWYSNTEPYKPPTRTRTHAAMSAKIVSRRALFSRASCMGRFRRRYLILPTWRDAVTSSFLLGGMQHSSDALSRLTRCLHVFDSLSSAISSSFSFTLAFFFSPLSAPQT